MRKVISLLLVLLLLASLCSCNGSSTDDKDKKQDCTHSYGEWYKEQPCDTLEWRNCKYCESKDFRTVDAGHKTNSSGVCINCGTKIIYSQEEIKNIIQIQFFNLGEYDGGALSEIKIVFKNTSQKEIDEIFFGVTGYYNGESDVHRCTYPGNVQPGAVAGNGHYYEPLWPSSGMYGVKISSINITYTDGTKERIFDDNVQLAFWEYTEEEKYEDFLTNGLANVRVGDVVKFGLYEQDNNLSNGKEQIEWIVLAKENGKALLISKYGLDSLPYDKFGNLDWKNCSLRTWLNDTFYNAAFDTREKALISSINVETVGSYTTDKVFILGKSEISSYYKSSIGSLKVTPTNYAQSNGANYYTTYNAGWWWVREIINGEIGFVSTKGSVANYGFEANREGASVRPAIWVDID